jgi:hypothetical protein
MCSAETGKDLYRDELADATCRPRSRDSSIRSCVHPTRGRTSRHRAGSRRSACCQPGSRARRVGPGVCGPRPAAPTRHHPPPRAARAAEPPARFGPGRASGRAQRARGGRRQPRDRQRVSIRRPQTRRGSRDRRAHARGRGGGLVRGKTRTEAAIGGRRSPGSHVAGRDAAVGNGALHRAGGGARHTGGARESPAAVFVGVWQAEASSHRTRAKQRQA